jgi:hypothetical protein
MRNKALGLAGERHHAHAHQLLLQATVKAGLGENGRIGVVKVLEKVLLHGRHVIDRLGHETGQFLEARKAVEFKRIEVRLTIVGVRNP